MPLFDGVENFTPALTGQQIAIGAGQGAGQSISRGMATAQRGKGLELEGASQDLSRQKFQFQKKQYEDVQPTIEDLSRMFEFLRTGMP